MTSSLVLAGVSLSVFALVIAQHGYTFQDSNAVDSNASPVFTEDFYKKAYSYAPYIGRFKNFTLQDMTDWLKDLEAWQEPQELKQNFPYYVSGYDMEDRPILIIEFGQFKIREVLEKGPKAVEDLERYIQKAGMNGLMSTMPGNSSRKDVRQVSAILDIAGFEYSQGIHVPTLTFARKITAEYGALLNVGVNKVVIINANYIGDVFFQLIKPLLGQLLERVDLYGSKKSKWIPLLRRAFPVESIPPWYGGSNKDFEPVMMFG